MKEIPLTRGYTTVIDDEDEHKIAGKWHANGYGSHVYATKCINYKAVLMHRFILDVTDPAILVDHCNGNTLDNRRENLRICDAFGNAQNSRKKATTMSSQFKGVSFYKRLSKFKASIRANKREFHLGYFETEEEAAQAYNLKAVELHGEFASLNSTNPIFPTKDLPSFLLTQKNKSGFRGVSWDMTRKKWVASITHKKKQQHIGRFSSPEAAARAYDQKAQELHGENARLNFPV